MNEKLFNDVTEILKEYGLTYKWLMIQLNAKGCDVNQVSLSKWVHGTQVSKKAEDVHAVCLKILKMYKKHFAEKVVSV